MKTPELQRSHTTEERGPSILQVAEEKTTKINIYNNHPMKYNGSPFESRTNDRKNILTKMPLFLYQKTNLNQIRKYLPKDPTMYTKNKNATKE